VASRTQMVATMTAAGHRDAGQGWRGMGLRVSRG
jgi:hypothetical protein